MAKNEAVDDRGTDQAAAAQILRTLRDKAFYFDNEKLAQALGRPTEEIEAWTEGTGTIDDDVVMKARGIAIQRGIEIEETEKHDHAGEEDNRARQAGQTGR